MSILKNNKLDTPRGIAFTNGERYYIGNPCKHGHQEGIRYTSTTECVKCCSIRDLGKHIKRKIKKNKFISIRNWGVKYDKKVEKLREIYNGDNELVIHLALDRLFDDHLNRKS